LIIIGDALLMTMVLLFDAIPLCIELLTRSDVTLVPIVRQRNAILAYDLE